MRLIRILFVLGALLGMMAGCGGTPPPAAPPSNISVDENLGMSVMAASSSCNPACDSNSCCNTISGPGGVPVFECDPDPFGCNITRYPFNQCGLVTTGCNGIQNCGTCPNGDHCVTPLGQVAQPGFLANCCSTFRSCAQQGKNCGSILTGCAQLFEDQNPELVTPEQEFCGTCPTGQVCSTSNNCCTPTTCTVAGAACGNIPDGCGSTLFCGDPNSTDGCNADTRCMSNNQCCVPRTCAQAGAQCGVIDNKCGHLEDCGETCPGGQICDQLTTQCCTPIVNACAAAGAICGSVSDGCGNMVPCGTCPANMHCVGNTTCAAGAPPPSVPALGVSSRFGLGGLLLGFGMFWIRRKKLGATFLAILAVLAIPSTTRAADASTNAATLWSSPAVTRHVL